MFPQFPAYFVTFTEEIPNEKLHFLWGVKEFIRRSVSLLNFTFQLFWYSYRVPAPSSSWFYVSYFGKRRSSDLIQSISCEVHSQWSPLEVDSIIIN